MSSDLGPVVRECVEGYLYARDPLRLLILRRPPERGRYWVPVSGKVEPDDRGYEAAVRREVEEETGLGNPRSVVDLDWHVTFRADNGETWRLHGFALETPPGFIPTLSSEHDAFDWVTPEEAEARFHFPDNRDAVRHLLARLAGSRNL